MNFDGKGDMILEVTNVEFLWMILKENSIVIKRGGGVIPTAYGPTPNPPPLVRRCVCEQLLDMCDLYAALSRIHLNDLYVFLI